MEVKEEYDYISIEWDNGMPADEPESNENSVSKLLQLCIIGISITTTEQDCSVFVSTLGRN